MLDLTRPSITKHSDPVAILREMLAFRRSSERSFSVLRVCRGLYRLSPALISLILAGKRRITPDRVEALSKLMGLSAAEKSYFKNLVVKNLPQELGAKLSGDNRSRSRKSVSTNILNDWLNVYVKDCFHISAIQKTPDLIYPQLGALASSKRIRKSFDFLLREGYLRHTTDGRIVIETNLAVAETPTPSHKVRNFHKAALKIAHQALDLHGPTERLANTLLVTVSPDRMRELVQLIHEFAEKLKDFAEVAEPTDDRLYQLIVNLSPTGGKVE